MLVLFSICDRISLLPQFFRYYSSIGATRFACGLYNGEENPLYPQVAAFTSQYALQIQTTVIAPFDQFRGAAEAPAMNRMREEFAPKDGWYCIADLDEFHFFGGKTMAEIVQEADAAGYEAVQGVFFDRVAADGSFPDINGPLDDLFPLACDLSRCAGLQCGKIALARSYVKITPGHHKAQAEAWPNAVEVHHFKWQKGIIEIVRDKHRRYTKQGIPWATLQLPRLLELIENGIDLKNPLLQVRAAARLNI